jgi:uncharacterized membrane protein
MFFDILCYPISISSKDFQESSMRQLKNLFVLLLLAGFSASSIASVSDVKLTSCSVYSLFVLLLLAGFSASSIASVSDVKLTSCSVYSEGETAPETSPETDGDKTTEEEEEPDCE